MHVIVVLPAHNEAGNLTPLITELFRAGDAARMDLEIVVIDDGSVDATGSELAMLGQTFWIKFSAPTLVAPSRNSHTYLSACHLYRLTVRFLPLTQRLYSSHLTPVNRSGVAIFAAPLWDGVLLTD